MNMESDKMSELKNTVVVSTQLGQVARKQLGLTLERIGDRATIERELVVVLHALQWNEHALTLAQGGTLLYQGCSEERAWLDVGSHSLIV